MSDAIYECQLVGQELRAFEDPQSARLSLCNTRRATAMVKPDV